jgi:hypothetical protein
MESNHVICYCRCAAFAITQLLVFSGMLTCGCGRQASSTQQISSADYNAQRERIERIIGVKLPESVRNCRYDSMSYGLGHGVGWFFFEISRADLSNLLDESDNLPNVSELGQDRVARENIERAMQQAGENLTWWKPLTLQKRQYASKVLASLRFIGGQQMDICVGEIRDDLMGVYLVYHCDL